MGSGTVLAEAAARGMRVLGADINPAPFKIASLYRFANIANHHRHEMLEGAECKLDSRVPSTFLAPPPLGRTDSGVLKAVLLECAANEQCDQVRLLYEALIVLLAFCQNLL